MQCQTFQALETRQLRHVRQRAQSSCDDDLARLVADWLVIKPSFDSPHIATLVNTISVAIEYEAITETVSIVLVIGNIVLQVFRQVLCLE